MQRRHFEALAECLRETRRQMGYISERHHNGFEQACTLMEDEMVRVFKQANPNFQADTFRDACKPATTYRNKSDGRSL